MLKKKWGKAFSWFTDSTICRGGAAAESTGAAGLRVHPGWRMHNFRCGELHRKTEPSQRRAPAQRHKGRFDLVESSSVHLHIRNNRWEASLGVIDPCCCTTELTFFHEQVFLKQQWSVTPNCGACLLYTCQQDVPLKTYFISAFLSITALPSLV